MQTDEESFVIETPRRPWWLRWLKRLGKWLLVAAVVIGVRQAWHHHQVTKKLQDTLAEIDRAEPGWRLQDIEAAREEIPEQENSARVVIAAAGQLPKKWPSPEFADRFTHLEPEKQLSPEELARLKQELDTVQPALAEARKLAGMPRGRHPITYKRNVFATLLPSQDKVRVIASLLTYDALRADQESDLRTALMDCQAAFNAGRSLGDEPFAVSQLIRMAGTALACRGVERALAQGQPPPEPLAAFQRLLVDEDAFPALLVSARGERAAQHATMDAIESGDIALSDMSGGRPDWKERLFGYLYRDNVRDEHPLMLAMLGRWIAVAQMPLPEQAQAEQALDQEIRNLPSNAIMTRLMLPAVSRLGLASRRNHAYLLCLNAALAAERYRQDNKRWPHSLADLCPKYLTAVPQDPFDGEPLRYRRHDEGVTIYAVGKDRTDNSGNLDPQRPDDPGMDVGVRLWDVDKRRQLPAQPPAVKPG